MSYNFRIVRDIASSFTLKNKPESFGPQWRIPRGFERSLPPPVFKYPMKMKEFGLSETKVFHFHGIFKKK